MSDVSPFVSAIIGGLVAALGWPIAHWLTRRREMLAEKRKLRVSYLLEAYRRLENAGNRSLSPDSEYWDNIEGAIADIQLLGTPRQIGLAVKLTMEMAETGSGSFDPLLYDMRNSLRKELELEPTQEPLKHFRVYSDKKPHPNRER